jgi:hypothetical protein
MPSYLKWGVAALGVFLALALVWIVLLGPAVLILLHPR